MASPVIPRGLVSLAAPLAACFALVFVLVSPAAAQTVGHADDGRWLAGQWCQGCHALAPGERSANERATPFPELAQEPSVTAFWLRGFLRTPHDRMPDIVLSRDQTDDLVAYILSLRRN